MERFFSSRSNPAETRKGFVSGEVFFVCASRGSGSAASASCKKERRRISCILGPLGLKELGKPTRRPAGRQLKAWNAIVVTFPWLPLPNRVAGASKTIVVGVTS
jgi:hypothetical protein